MLVFGMNKRIAITDKHVKLFKGHYTSTIIRILVIIVLPCVVWGSYQTSLLGLKAFDSFNLKTVIVLIPLIFFIMLHLVIWTIVAQRLYSLMEGDYTINRFCERLKPVRERVLKRFNIEAEYME